MDEHRTRVEVTMYLWAPAGRMNICGCMRGSGVRGEEGEEIGRRDDTLLLMYWLRVMRSMIENQATTWPEYDLD